jgi:ADP-ribosylglycohydrolase
LETELFGLIAPGMPNEARRRATYFARVTNSGPAVDAAAFYATMYSLAFFESDVQTLVHTARSHIGPQSEIGLISGQVLEWHGQFPDDWRETRRRIRATYDTDASWTASRVNFAATIMALLYGDGDFLDTLALACLAGWDADNNATTSAGLLGLVLGYDGLPPAVRNASNVYYNEDVTGDMPRFQTIEQIAARTQALAEAAVRHAGGTVTDGEYRIARR